MHGAADGDRGRWVILVRHGEAVPRADDPQRPLTPRGRAETERVARRLTRLGIAIRGIRHSGKRRAEETAVILAAACEPRLPVERWEGLGPDDPVAPIARRLEREASSVLLVGHLPHLARLASLLLCGSAEAEVVVLPPSGAAVLVRREGGWSLVALLPPELA